MLLLVSWLLFNVNVFVMIYKQIALKGEKAVGFWADLRRKTEKQII